MKPRYLVSTTIFLLLSSHPISGQSTESKIELGPQFTSLTIFQEFGVDTTEPGFGARFTYNIENASVFPRRHSSTPVKGRD